MKVSEFFKTKYVAWASYDNLRSISSAIDGLKIASRKTIFTVKKKNINKDMKVSALSNTIILEAEYLHGDASLNGVISNMAQQFTGSNNLSWISPESAFGTRQNPAASAPRYIFTKKTDYFDFLIPSDDDNILNHQTFEGHNIDPKFYLPIMPMLLINGSNGISPGARQLIFARSVKKLHQHLLTILEGKPSKYNFAPYWNGFKGEITQGDSSKQWIIKGKLEIKNTTAVEITEVPIRYTYKSYIKVLDELEEIGKITGYDDFCNPKTGEFKFIVKFTRQNLSMLDHSKLMILLKLIQNESEIYTIIDETNRLRYFTDVRDVFNIFYETRLNGYQLRKDSMLISIQKDIDYNKNRSLFIKEFAEGNINLRDDIKTLENRLISLNIAKYESSFDYLLNMNIKSLTKEGYQRVLEKIIELENHLEYIRTTSIQQMWIDDLKKLNKFIKE
jgi:DNA topoisomerase-2